MNNQFYHVTNLLLADKLAQAYGNNRAAAIKRCARKIRDNTHDCKLHDLARQIVGAPDHKLTEITRRLEIGLRAEGLLN